MKQLVLFALIGIAIPVFSQADSIVLSNGNVIVGEIKEMTKSVLTMETDYSDSDFKIEWEKVVEIHSGEIYALNLSDRSVFTGATFETVAPGRVRVSGEEGIREVPILNIVYLRELDDSFFSKLSASVDIGYSITKASNLHQYNADVGLGYKSDRWILTSTYRQVRSSQDSVAPIRRIEGALTANYALKNGVFFGASLNFLSNTEQNLDLRTTGTVGSGYYFVRTNAWLWSSFLGLAFNNEQFESSPETMDGPSKRESYEGLLGTTLDIYDLGDIDVLTTFKWYPSITEAGRNRIDYDLNLKYDLPLDFYIKGGLTFNYDSDPAAGASNLDYVVLTGFGWEL